MRKYFFVPLFIIGLLALVYLVVINFPKLLSAATDAVNLQATVLTYITTSVDSATKAFGNITPTVAAYATSTQTTATNNSTGYNVKVNRDDSNTTMDLDSDASVNITDQTAWNPGANKSTAGNATTTANFDNSGYVLAFRASDTSNACGFSSTWWGTDASNKLYGGFPTTAKTTFDCDSYQSGSTLAYHEYRLNVSATQQTGAYSGGITYTITANP